MNWVKGMVYLIRKYLELGKAERAAWKALKAKVREEARRINRESR